MKDMTGSEIEVGDILVYAVGGGAGRIDLVEATVESVKPDSVRVIRKGDPKARLVSIHFPERCRVVDNAPKPLKFRDSSLSPSEWEAMVAKAEVELHCGVPFGTFTSHPQRSLEGESMAMPSIHDPFDSPESVYTLFGPGDKK